MLSFDVRSNVRDVIRQTGQFSHEISERALHYALTATAMDVKEAEVRSMSAVFSNPVRWTLNSLYVKAATKQSRTAMVHFRDFAPKGVPASRYLYTQIHGSNGSRPQKAHEKQLSPYMRGHRYTVPGRGAKLDGHGNMRGGEFTRILSQLQVGTDATQRARKAGSKGYFVAGPGSHLSPGVYKRQGKGLKAVLLFKAQVSYRPRFPFYAVADQVARARFEDHLKRELIETARRVFGRVGGLGTP